MKTNFIAALVIAVQIFIVGPQSTQASTFGAGNGGDGVIAGEEIFLLDLVEAGMEQDPQFDLSLKDTPGYAIAYSIITEKMPDADTYTRMYFALKIAEIKNIHLELGFLLQDGMRNFQWNFVNYDLMPINDEDDVINVPQTKLVQLAGRTSSVIRIDRALWSKLNPKHRAALLFHELLYSAVVPGCIEYWPGSSTCKRNKQFSRPAKDLNGYLFGKQLKQGGVRGLNLAIWNSNHLAGQSIGWSQPQFEKKIGDRYVLSTLSIYAFPVWKDSPFETEIYWFNDSQEAIRNDSSEICENSKLISKIELGEFSEGETVFKFIPYERLAWVDQLKWSREGDSWHFYQIKMTGGSETQLSDWKTLDVLSFADKIDLSSGDTIFRFNKEKCYQNVIEAVTSWQKKEGPLGSSNR